MISFKKISFFKFNYVYMICLALVVTMIYIMLEKTGEMFNNEDDSTKVTVIDGDKYITFKLEHCNCKRTFKMEDIETNQDIKFNKTTCSMDAFRRGGGQKIVGFSFYGDINSNIEKVKGYFEGIGENLKLMPMHYPGWIMRLYFDLDKKDPVLHELCKLACNDSNLDICDAENLPGIPVKNATEVFAMNWRFFPTLDPQVDIYVSRDLDSSLNNREKAAVEEWLKSDKDFHFMRDHPQHGTTILGSGWGTKLHNPNVREEWKKSWANGMKDDIFWAKRTDKGPDQVFLDRYVWPWSNTLSIGHDSYLCEHYPYTQPFPTERENVPNNFVASVVKENVSIWVECPEKCRPANHMDWVHC